MRSLFRPLQYAANMICRGRALKSSFAPRGRFHIQQVRNGSVIREFDVPNGITDVGLNHILETQFHAGTPVSTWYIGLIDNASYSALADEDTMASHAGWIESADYTEANRPEWTAGDAAARAMTNAATVDFTMNATKTIKGIFITSDDTKSGSTGTLWSTAAFASTVSLVATDVLKVTYTVSG